MTTGSSRSSHPIMKLFDIGIIKRIYITQSQQHPTHHMFYVYCIDESSTQHLPYFYIRVDELHYLATLPPLPTQHTPLTWSKYVKPSIRMCSLCYSPDHVHSRCPHRNDPSIRFCATCGSSSHLAKQCHADIICKCCEKAGHNVLECTRFRPSYTPLQLAPNLSAFPPLTSTSTSASPTSTSSSPLSWSSVVQRSALRDTSSPSPPHKRMRHTSFDSDSVSSYNSRDNHSPLSPAFQEYLDQSSLTRSSSNSLLSSRSPTPSPSRSSSRSSRSSSSQSTSSDAALIKMLQQTIQQQQQQITQLQQQLQQLLQLTKQTSNPQQQRQPPPPPQQQQQQQQQQQRQQLTNAHVMSD